MPPVSKGGLYLRFPNRQGRLRNWAFGPQFYRQEFNSVSSGLRSLESKDPSCHPAFGLNLPWKSNAKPQGWICLARTSSAKILLCPENERWDRPSKGLRKGLWWTTDWCLTSAFFSSAKKRPTTTSRCKGPFDLFLLPKSIRSFSRLCR